MDSSKLEQSFKHYRSDISTSSDNEEKDSDVVEDSDDSSFFSRNRAARTPNVKSTVIPDSCSEGSGSDSDDSAVIKPTRNNIKKKIILSDSDEDSEDVQHVPNESEDNMVMSSATRMSIYGTKRLSAASDESDFIESDCEERKFLSLSECSLSDMLPNPHVMMSSTRLPDSDPDATLTSNNDICQYPSETPEFSTFEESLKMIPNPKQQEVIHLSSDDESLSIVVHDDDDDVVETIETPIFNAVRDKTYPNSGVIYVSKQVKENEMNKLMGLKQDLQKVNYLLDSMRVSTLPDKGVKLNQRAETLKREVRAQAEKVSNMVVEPVVPTEKQIKSDGFISWDELKASSAAVQPRMFGTQAMNTHMTQRTMTLERLRDLHASLGTRPAEDEKTATPRAVNTQLMPHQLHALTWLAWRETQRPRGGILADDMGLGKTLTMISLIIHSKEENKDNPDNRDDDDEENDDDSDSRKYPTGGTLVICPASLLSQWHGEIMNHCKKNVLKVLIHHGLKRETKANRLAQNDVVITTYNLVQRELEKTGALTRVRWTRVILDEAHTVRNHKSLTAQAIFKLKAWSRWCLTGTPVHNKDLDLFALLKFLRCSPFDDIVLWKKWIDNKSTGGQERLSAIMKTLLLRRTKQQLQEENSLECLPQKTVHCIDVKLSREEMIVYQKVLVFSKNLFGQFLHQRAQKQNGLEYSSEKIVDPNGAYYKMHKKMVALHGVKPVKSHEILVLLLRLRQICCHAGLIHSMLNNELYEENLEKSNGDHDPESDLLSELAKMNLDDEIDNEPPNGAGAGDSQTTVDTEGTSVAEAMSRVLSSSNPVFDLKQTSTKIQAILKCLEENVFTCRDDKAVVVSQWTGMLDIIEEHLKKNGVRCTTLSGKVPVTSRQEIVKQFNDSSSNIQVLLLSLCAGGVGLNLVGGNHLLLVDLHWNPQLEAQAQDRIYRVGQKKSVHIYKFMCVETVENSIKILQDKKLALAENVLTGAKMMQSSKLSIEDLKLMFNMQ